MARGTQGLLEAKDWEKKDRRQQVDGCCYQRTLKSRSLKTFALHATLSSSGSGSSRKDSCLMVRRQSVHTVTPSHHKREKVNIYVYVRRERKLLRPTNQPTN